MDRVYLRVVEVCRFKIIFYSGVDDAAICHRDELSDYVCGNYSSSKVFCFLNDDCIRCGLLPSD